jgi:hypothetical protein
MEKKIIVPVTLQKDARLDLDVDVELEVSCSLSHQVVEPPPPKPPPAVKKSAPELPVKKSAPELPVKKSAPAAAAKPEPGPEKKDAEDKPRRPRTKIDSVLDDLLRKVPKR